MALVLLVVTAGCSPVQPDPSREMLPAEKEGLVESLYEKFLALGSFRASYDMSSEECEEMGFQYDQEEHALFLGQRLEGEEAIQWMAAFSRNEFRIRHQEKEKTVVVMPGLRFLQRFLEKSLKRRDLEKPGPGQGNKEGQPLLDKRLFVEAGFGKEGKGSLNIAVGFGTARPGYVASWFRDALHNSHGSPKREGGSWCFDLAGEDARIGIDERTGVLSFLRFRDQVNEIRTLTLKEVQRVSEPPVLVWETEEGWKEEHPSLYEMQDIYSAFFRAFFRNNPGKEGWEKATPRERREWEFISQATLRYLLQFRAWARKFCEEVRKSDNWHHLTPEAIFPNFRMETGRGESELVAHLRKAAKEFFFSAGDEGGEKSGINLELEQLGDALEEDIREILKEEWLRGEGI